MQGLGRKPPPHRPLMAGKETGPQPYVWPRGLNSAYTRTSEEIFPIPHPRPQPCWPLTMVQGDPYGLPTYANAG